MFLPIGDSPNFKSTPWVTYILIAVNVLVFLVMVPQQLRRADPRNPEVWEYVQTMAEAGMSVREVREYDLVVFKHGFKPGRPELVDAFTCMFLHGGWLHLIGNMLFLWIYGDNVEHRLGRVGYLAAYLGAGLAAVLGDSLLRAGSPIPSVGASGAISGILGFYFIWFPRNTVRVWVFLFPIFAGIVELPARLVLGFFIIVDNLLPALLGGSSGVAYGAHLGGFVAAMGAASVIDHLRLRRPEPAIRGPRPSPGPRSGSERAVPSQADELRRAMASGDLGGAMSVLAQMPSSVTRASVDPGLVIRLGESLAAAGHPRAGLAVLHRVLAEHPRGASAAEAHLSTARILMHQLGTPAGAYQHLVQVLENEKGGAAGDEARDLLRRLAASGVVPQRFRSA